MTDRNYRLLFGLGILLTLYFDLAYVMYGLIGLIFLEGVTNWRIPLLVNRFMQKPDGNALPVEEALDFKWPFHVERTWRLVVGFMLFLTAVLFNEVAWFLPWFMGFAIFGAGVSGVCPMLLGLRSVGCRS